MDPTYNYNYQYSGNMPPESGAAAFAFAGGMFIFVLLVILVVYILVALSLMKIAERTNTPNAWFAWIPILNLILMLQIANRPMWWLIFWLVPILNIAGIVLNFVIWVDIAKRLGKSAVMGVLAVIIPIIFMPYLAFSKSDIQAQ
ncbi:MAG: DUF5684 domain-containing protein [Parcubacteria group bacterium]|jgi:hypothetical protein